MTVLNFLFLIFIIGWTVKRHSYAASNIPNQIDMEIQNNAKGVGNRDDKPKKSQRKRHGARNQHRHKHFV
jgi:hypothetical protein